MRTRVEPLCPAGRALLDRRRFLSSSATALGSIALTNLLGHPLNVVLWLKDSLAAEGKRLKKGDLLSLGTITKLMPVRPGTTVKARYLDLDPAGPVEISAHFE